MSYDTTRINRGYLAAFADTMLLIANETIRSNQTLSDVVREMSFTLSFFAKPSTFTELMTGQSRRIVLLTESDVTSETVSALTSAKDRMQFAVIIAARCAAANKQSSSTSWRASTTSSGLARSLALMA